MKSLTPRLRPAVLASSGLVSSLLWRAGIFVILAGLSQAWLSQVGLAQTAPAGAVSGTAVSGTPVPEKIASVEGIAEYRLGNGMDVLLFADNSKPTVTVNVTYMVGSRFEGYGETGMAHLLEHMLFKGTDTRNDIAAELRNRGANYNGSTWFDRTNYFETLPASPGNLRYALEMEADRMIHSRVSRQDLDTEMTVVRSEFERGENNPMSVLEERVLSTAYLWHGYGRSSIGSRSDIENVPIDRLQAFYRMYYQPDNAMLVVAGKFEEAQTLAWIQQIFGAIPRPSRKLIPTYTQEPVQDGEREVTLRRTGDIQAVTSAYHIPAGSHPDFAAIEILEAILSDVPSGRLYKALVETKKAVSTRGEAYQLHDPGMLLVSAQVRKEGSLDDVEKTLLGVVDGVVKEPPSKEEVDRARTRLLKDIDLAFNNSGRIGVQLSEWQSMGDWRLMFLNRDRIKNVTPEDVARVAKLYLKTSNRTIGLFLPTADPDRAEIPATPDLAAIVKDYKGQAAVEAGEVFDPSPANIESRTVRVTLRNGMKLVLLSKKTRGGTVTARLDLHYGDEKSVFGKTATAQIAGTLLMHGTQKHTKQQVQDDLDQLKAQMNATGAVTGATVNLNTVRAGFPGALRLAAEILREPSFPESDFEQVRQAVLGRIEGARSEPQALVVNAMNRHLSPYPSGDPRAIATFDEDIESYKKATLADVKKFYTDFYGASNAELAVTGDFDVAEVQRLAEELFGDWKSPGAYSLVKRNWQKLEPVNRLIETPDKANAFFAAATTLNLGETDPDYPAMLLANTMIGGGAQSRLFLRIREKEGLSYAVQSEFVAGSTYRYGQFLGIAICNPQNIAKVESAFKDEMGKIVNLGFTADEVETAKKAFLEERQVNRSQDPALVRVLQRDAQFGWTMAHDAEIDQKIAALTAGDINAAVKRQLDLASLSYFKGGDFKKAGITQ
jgi:zinc protease